MIHDQVGSDRSIYGLDRCEGRPYDFGEMKGGDMVRRVSLQRFFRCTIGIQVLSRGVAICMAILICGLLPGCGREESSDVQATDVSATVEVEDSGDEAEMNKADLEEAEEIVRSFWKDIIGKEYSKAVEKTEVKMQSAKVRERFEAQFSEAYADVEEARIIFVGPGRWGDSNEILVPYALEGDIAKENEAVLRKQDAESGWLIYKGF